MTHLDDSPGWRGTRASSAAIRQRSGMEQQMSRNMPADPEPIWVGMALGNDPVENRDQAIVDRPKRPWEVAGKKAAAAKKGRA